MKKAVVLLSAGLDSTVNLYAAHRDLEIVLALTFDYGQKAAAKEKYCSQRLAEQLGVPHKVIDLGWFRDFGASSLIQSNQKIPTDQVKINDLPTSQQTARSVWVPNRNGIFLNIAAGFAESLEADYVIPGFNAEEAVTFPDNSTEFMGAMDSSLKFSTANHVRIHCLTDKLNKPEIAKLAVELGVPISNLWPCYFPGEKWCGECESCQRSKRAFRTQGIETKGLFLVNE
ncbi:MAG: 7-cyano-7-deazaguanine synthase QueC [Bdellovibrionales bacterium]|nr:7-cyano-7-deazaguanine synthase QueC [Bdellovibrionales bacterium]